MKIDSGNSVFPFALFFFICSIILPQDNKSLYDNEKKFCKTLTEIGMSRAFTQFMAPDGIMFAPTPVSGMEHFKKNPSEFKSLFWEADFAEISISGDFGYTTGPWYRPVVGKDKDTTYAYGHFNTVWQKIDGEWKFLIDCGINYSPEAKKKNQSVKPALKTVSPPEIKRNRFYYEEVFAAEGKFTNIAEMEGMNAAYKEFASENIRVYRENNYPITGLENAKELIANAKMGFINMGGAASQAGDFAYSFGTGGVKDVTKEFNYLRIWKREGKEWKIVLDQLTPIIKN